MARVLETKKKTHVVVVGGGAGGVELALAMQHRLRSELEKLDQPGDRVEFALVTRGELMPTHPAATRKTFRGIFEARGVELVEHDGVENVTATAVQLASGRKIPADECIWCTQAAPQAWPGDSGLDTDDGFIEAVVQEAPDLPPLEAEDAAFVALHKEVRERAAELGIRTGLPQDVVKQVLEGVVEPGRFADLVAGYLEISPSERQGLLETRGVEERLRRALQIDKARVQTGRISRFGLLEMSRQRLRPSLGDSSQESCPRCSGHGHIRSIESLALSILRLVEEEAMKEFSGQIEVQAPVVVANFLLNEKRSAIQAIETRHRVPVMMISNEYMETPRFEIHRIRKTEVSQDPLNQLVLLERSSHLNISQYSNLS